MQQLHEMRENAQQGTTAIKKVEDDPIKGKLVLMDKRKDMLGAGIPGHMLVEREIRSAGIALMNSRDLQQSSASSFYTAVSVAINSGIGLGRGMGYLVAYKGNCQYVPGWRGLVDLVSRTGRASVWTGVVHKGDEFDYALGDSPFLTHKPGDDEDFKSITHYYSVGRVKGADYPVIEVWSANKVAKHLAKFNKVGTRHYALKDDNNMEHYGRKVVLLQVIKYLPQSQEIANALAADAAHEAGKQNVIDGNMVWVDDQDYGAPVDPLAGEVQQDQQPVQQQAAQQRQQPQGDVIDQDTGEVVQQGDVQPGQQVSPARAQINEALAQVRQQRGQPAQTAEEADYQRSQQQPAAPAQEQPGGPVPRTRRRTAGAAPE